MGGFLSGKVLKGAVTCAGTWRADFGLFRSLSKFDWETTLGLLARKPFLLSSRPVVLTSGETLEWPFGTFSCKLREDLLALSVCKPLEDPCTLCSEG